MKEQDYLIATNLAKVRIAIAIVSDVFVGPAHRVEDEEWRATLITLRKWEQRLEVEVDS